MTWTCEKCATRHETPEQQKACWRRRRRETAALWLTLIAILSVIAVVVVAWNAYAYGDWRCAFMHCVKVTK